MKIRDGYEEDQRSLIRLGKCWIDGVQAVFVEVYLNGHPGAFRREWQLVNGRATTDQIADLVTWLCEYVYNSVLTTSTIEELLSP